MSEALKKIKDFKYELLASMLDTCTEKQQVFFHKLFPGGVKKVPESKLESAIQLVERTITKNNKASVG